VPRHKALQELLALHNAPLLATTLIAPDETEPMNDAQLIRERYERQIAGVLDAGACPRQATTVVDLWRRYVGGGDSRKEMWVSRIATFGWGCFAIAFAEYASRLGSLVEAVNILGSLFYGTILGIFLVAFYVKHVRGGCAFYAALLGRAGWLRDCLELVLAYEKADWITVAERAETVGAPENEIPNLYVDAVTWAQKSFTAAGPLESIRPRR